MNKCYIIGRQAAGREGCFRIQPEKHSAAQAWDSRDNAGLVVRYGDTSFNSMRMNMFVFDL